MIAPPPPPALAAPPVAFGVVAARVGPRTRVLEAQADGRLVARLRLPPGPRRVGVPVPAGLHTVRVRARGPGGVRWSRALRVWVLPRTTRRPGRLGGRVDVRLQREVDALAGTVPAVTGVWVQHLGTGCGAARNAGAGFPAASTLKAAILIEAVRQAGGEPSPALDRLLDAMVLDSDDRAANAVLAVLGGGSPYAGAAAVTATMGRLGMSSSLARAPYIIDRAAQERGPRIPVETREQPALFTNFVSTPRDLAQLLLAVHQGALGRGPVRRLGLGSRAVRREVLRRLLEVRDATKLAAGVPAGVPLAHKSGFTQQVKHDAGLVYLRRGPVVAVAMSWSAAGVDDATGDPFIARVAEAAVRRLGGGGRCT